MVITLPLKYNISTSQMCMFPTNVIIGFHELSFLTHIWLVVHDWGMLLFVEMVWLQLCN